MSKGPMRWTPGSDSTSCLVWTTWSPKGTRGSRRSAVAEVGARDPLTFVAVPLLLLAAALAGWVPARRAARVDPPEALRAG